MTDREQDRPLNRKQRRDYVRENQTRQGRKNLVGFGAWSRHHEDPENRHHGLVDAPAPTPGLKPRALRRTYKVAEAKARRRLLRQQSRGRIT